MSSIVHAFTSRRMFIILLLGFSSGLPLGLTGAALQAWMYKEGVNLGTIGIFAVVGTPYAIKFLWAPLMDHYAPQFLGRRRGWMVITQLLLILSIYGMSLFNPATETWAIAALAVAVAFFSASQDIVVDAYRTDILRPEERGLGAGVSILGYRMAMLVTGSVALILADQFPWPVVYQMMAAGMLIGVLGTLLAPEPAFKEKVQQTLVEAFYLPLVEFFKRPGIVEVFLFILLYKLDAVLTLALMTPFFLSLGFSQTEIGVVAKGFGLVATIVGALTGGAIMVKLGLKRSLWTFGILQGLAGGSFLALAIYGHNYWLMATAITMENFFGGLGTAAYTAFLMAMCNQRFSATQYAVLSSLMALTRMAGAAPAGYLVEAVGYQIYYVIAILVSVPALLLLLRYDVWMSRRPDTN